MAYDEAFPAQEDDPNPPPLHSLPPSPIKGLHNELPITTLIELALFLRAERVENFPSSAVCVWVCV